MTTTKRTKMANPIKSSLKDGQGNYVVLTSELARGGQGAVYRVAQRDDVVCKIFDFYENAKAAEPKVLAMIAAPPDDPTRANGHVSIAWPTALVRDSFGRCVGFLMPLVAESVPVENYFRHSTRNNLPFKPGLKEVYRIVRNTAAIFSAMHKKGYVVGDVNPRNILVRKDAMCAIIDCDSMQVPVSNTKPFLCTVYVAELTAPELLKADLNKTVRTTDSELFSIAVLFFKLMMEGFHPFQGIPIGNELVSDVQIENMRRGIFPYLPNADYTIAKVSPTFDCLSPTIQDLFRRAFTMPGNRPSADEWYEAFIRNEERLVFCQNDMNHVYPLDGSCVSCSVLSRFGKLKVNPKPGPVVFVHEKQPAPPRPPKIVPPPSIVTPARKTINHIRGNGFASCAVFTDGTATFWGGAPLYNASELLLEEAYTLRKNTIEDHARRCLKQITTHGTAVSARPIMFLSHQLLDANEAVSKNTNLLLAWLRETELNNLAKSRAHLERAVWKNPPVDTGLSLVQLSNTGAYVLDRNQMLTYVPFDFVNTKNPKSPAIAPEANPLTRLFSIIDDVGISMDTSQQIIRFGRSETTIHEISDTLALELNDTVVQLLSREVGGRVTTIARRSDMRVFEWVKDIKAIDGFAQSDQNDFHIFDDIRDVALSAFGCLFLKKEGTVRAWRRGNFTQIVQVPVAAQNDVLAIAAGVGHYVALKRDGTVVVWGDNSHGQCAVPTHLKNVVKIACGDYHTLALTRDHTIYAWGDNRRGQCDVPASLRA